MREVALHRCLIDGGGDADGGGRYCAPDPEQDFGAGYDGKDVVVENLRQLCVHRVANESGRPWTWWDYVMDYKIRCSMKEKKYSKTCAEDVVTALGEFILPASGSTELLIVQANNVVEWEPTRVGSEEGARVHGRPRGRRRERRAVQGAGGPGLVLALNLLQA